MNRLAFKLVFAFTWAISLLPLGLLRAVGRGLGRLGHGLDRRHRDIARENLRRAFPERDEAWVRATARGCFEHFGMVIFECFRLSRYDAKRIISLVRVHGLDNAQQAQEQGKGLIMFGAHYGNWEWMIAANGVCFHPMAAVFRPLDWQPADRLVNQWRTKTGNRQVDKNRGFSLIRELKRGGVVGILLDQGMDYYNGVWVDFFGRPACTSYAVARLARATGAQVLGGFLRRAADGKFDLHYLPVVPLADSGDPTKDDWENTQRFTKEIERFVREAPEQWFWVHNRWKHKPCSVWPKEGG